MVRDSHSLLSLIGERITAAGACPDLYFRDAVEIVLFGSFACGVERLNSDIDVLCVGKFKGKLKTNSLDFIAISQTESQDQRWQQSELAGHIYRYGIWLKGTSQAPRFSSFSRECIEAKSRRVAAFVRRLPGAWEDLDPCFITKYSLKVRRETQRLILLESGIAVPPTRILDAVPPDGPERSAVCDRLHRIIGQGNGRFRDTFIDTMLREWTRISLGS